MRLVANYYGCELAFVLVREYDVGLLLPLLVKCYEMMMLVMQQVEVQVEASEVNNEDLFQTSKINVEVVSQIVARELDAFCRHHVDVENQKCALSWWHIHEQGGWQWGYQFNKFL